MRRDRVLQDWVRDGPTVLGIERLADFAQEIRVTAAQFFARIRDVRSAGPS
jgi:hypothetical protein